MMEVSGELVPAASFRDPIVGLIGTIAHAKKYVWAEDPGVAQFISRLDDCVSELAGLLPENQEADGR